MLHKRRTWAVCPVASPEDLACKLKEHTWTYDTGFELGGYLFLNDSAGPDGGQEYAIVKKPSEEGRPFVQLETITFSWTNYEKALGIIKQAIAGEYDKSEWAHEVEPKLEPAFDSLRNYVAYLKCDNTIPVVTGEESGEETLTRVSVPGRIAEVTEETYWHFLEVLPPRWMKGWTFCFAEGAEPYRLFWRDRDHRHFVRQLGWDETSHFLKVAAEAHKPRENNSQKEAPCTESEHQAKDNKWYVASLAWYVVVDAQNHQQAINQGKHLFGERLVTVRLATPDEIEITDWHQTNLQAQKEHEDNQSAQKELDQQESHEPDQESNAAGRAAALEVGVSGFAASALRVGKREPEAKEETKQSETTPNPETKEAPANESEGPDRTKTYAIRGEAACFTLIAAAHHRNGMCGAPFDVVLFEDRGQEGSRKVGIVFQENCHCAVLDVGKLAAGDIAFASNSWRGDLFEPGLREAIRDQEEQIHRKWEEELDRKGRDETTVKAATVEATRSFAVEAQEELHQVSDRVGEKPEASDLQPLSRNERNQPMAENQNEKNEPLYDLRSGRIQGCIWDREGPNGETRYTVSLARSYRDKDGNWQRVSSFDPEDLPRVKEVLARVEQILKEELGQDITSEVKVTRKEDVKQGQKQSF